MKSLICEDDFTYRKILLKFLSSFSDCDVAASGDEAIKAYLAASASGEPYDLICLDILLPGLSGNEILREIRKHEESQGIGGSQAAKVIMTTGLNDKQTILSSFRDGCEAYLVKPVDHRKLFSELVKLGVTPARQENSREVL